MAAAIVIKAGAVLLLHRSAHRSYYVLPSASIEPGESAEAACLRGALADMRASVAELGKQLRINLDEDQLSFTIERKVGAHAWNARQVYHYFLVVGNGKSILSSSASLPYIDPSKFFWLSYEWVPLEELPHKNLHPEEAAAICRQAGLGFV